MKHWTCESRIYFLLGEQLIYTSHKVDIVILSSLPQIFTSMQAPPPVRQNVDDKTKYLLHITIS